MLVAVGTHSQNNLSGVFISIELLLKEKDGVRLGTRYLSIRFCITIPYASKRRDGERSHTRQFSNWSN